MLVLFDCFKPFSPGLRYLFRPQSVRRSIAPHLSLRTQHCGYSSPFFFMRPARSRPKKQFGPDPVDGFRNHGFCASTGCPPGIGVVSGGARGEDSYTHAEAESHAVDVSGAAAVHPSGEDIQGINSPSGLGQPFADHDGTEVGAVLRRFRRWNCGQSTSRNAVSDKIIARQLGV